MKYNETRVFWASFSHFPSKLLIWYQVEGLIKSIMVNITKNNFFFINKCLYWSVLSQKCFFIIIKSQNYYTTCTTHFITIWILKMMLGYMVKNQKPVTSSEKTASHNKVSRIVQWHNIYQFQLIKTTYYRLSSSMALSADIA